VGHSIGKNQGKGKDRDALGKKNRRMVLGRQTKGIGQRKIEELRSRMKRPYK